jgi:pilus assembly protein CpaF
VTDMTATTDAAGTVTTPAVDPALVLRVTERLALDGRPPSAAAVAAATRAEGVVLGAAGLRALATDVRAELTGLGPLQPLLDGDVSDVLVNAPDEVWVDRGSGLQRVPVRFRDEAAVRRLAQRLAASAGRRLDMGRATVDARLAGGVRLHAVVPPLSPSGTLISLRVLRRKAFGLDELVECGTVLPELAGLLEALVVSRASFLVTGGTGSGKTTVLAALLSLVPATERVVLVEDAGELAPDHHHLLRLEARTANVEGAGAVDLRSLVREALRMRPDRIVVGEVRGAEVVELLAALNTGHDGGAGTLHASSASTVPARLEALGLAAGLPRAAVHSQVAAGVQAVVHLERARDGRRVVREVGCFARGPDGLCSVATAVRTEGDRLVEGPGAGLLSLALAGPR